jgi:5,10-methylenetetrahydromethanopterin reductase
MTIPFELGLAIDGFTPAADIAAQARAAEAGGVDTLWIATHLFLRDPVALGATALAATKTLKVALMAVSPYAMHPVHAAMGAATLDELFPGRVVLCLGVGAPGDQDAAGIERPRPLATLREAIAVCRALFSGNTIDHQGDVFNVTQRRLVNAPCDIPIVLAASGPKMLELAGSDADGVIISGATSAPFVESCLARVTAAADGRKIKNSGIVYTGIDGDGKAGADSLRRTLGFILRGGHHAENVRMGGASLDQEALRDAYAAENWDDVDRFVTDDVVTRHAACGDAAHVRARLAEYNAAGLDHVIVSGITDPAEIAAVLSAVTADN